MRGLKFSTVVNASGFSMLLKGDYYAIRTALNRGYERLERVSGIEWVDAEINVETLPRTGDNIRMRVTWQQNARA